MVPKYLKYRTIGARIRNGQPFSCCM